MKQAKRDPDSEMKEENCLIFADSPVEDVNHAKSFWKSLTLQPPLESRLVSADIRQRLRVATPPEKSKVNPLKLGWEERKTAVFLHKAHEEVLKEEKEKYQKTMSQREAALNLLHKQRIERLQKEAISIQFKPKQRNIFKEVEEDYILDELE